jgi:DNA-binding MarR family transcriptional regulator
MKLEEELKSSKVLAPKQRALLNILFTASWVNTKFNRDLRPYGLTNPQYNILRILKGSAPKELSILDIKSRMIDRSSNVSRLVDKLYKNELVERCNNSNDRRMLCITITALGEKVLLELDDSPLINENLTPGQALSDEEAFLLANLLDKFRL